MILLFSHVNLYINIVVEKKIQLLIPIRYYSHPVTHSLSLLTRLHGTITFTGSFFPDQSFSIQRTAESADSLKYTSTDVSGGLENSEKLVLLKLIIPICSGIMIFLSLSALINPGAAASLATKIASGYSSSVCVSRYSSILS